MRKMHQQHNRHVTEMLTLANVTLPNELMHLSSTLPSTASSPTTKKFKPTLLLVSPRGSLSRSRAAACWLRTGSLHLWAQLLAASCWPMAPGRWLLVPCCWLLVADCWLIGSWHLLRIILKPEIYYMLGP